MEKTGTLFSAVLMAILWLVSLTADAAAQQKPPTAFEHVHALAIDPAGEALFLGAHTGLFRSADGGRSWKKIIVSSKYAHLDLMSIAIDPRDGRAIYVATHEAGVFKSGDGGVTWKEMNKGLLGMDVHGLTLDANTPSKLFAAVRDKGEGIYRTNDGGAKWSRAADGPEGEVKTLASVNLSSGVGGIFLYAATSSGLQRSPDCF
jgi:photosystem II stability/assembly factor-like uncharacterized protein